MIHCVSTMNKAYYDGIGKLMIHTWKECAPQDYVLHLYLEDFSLESEDRIFIEDWTEVSDLYQVWSTTRHSDNARHQKFTLKALSQIALISKLGKGKVLWLDADLIFIKPLPDDFFDSLIQDYPLASWGEYSFESGTVWMNLDHPKWPDIFNEYKSIYIGEKGLPEGERWFDGELLGRAVKDSGAPYRNLREICTAKTSTPLNWSWTGDYVRHFKAKGKTRLRDDLIKELNRLDLVELLDDQGTI